MRSIILLAAISTAACSASWGAEHRTLIRTANVATASIAAAGTALDWCGTRHAANTRTDDFEGGMLTMPTIGTRPSAGAVDAYFAITTAVVVGASRLIPERYRWLAYGAVAAVELSAVHSNLSTTRCGPIGPAGV